MKRLKNSERKRRPNCSVRRKIGADPIHGEIVGIGALAIHTELVLVAESFGSYPPG